jgi:hypothetical protein
VYRPGRENKQADALSRNPIVQAVHTEKMSIKNLLDQAEHGEMESEIECHVEQRKDDGLREFMELDRVPNNVQRATSVAAQAASFAIIDKILYFTEKEGKHGCIVAPGHLRRLIIKEYHGGVYGGHFSVGKLVGAISRKWWWASMYRDVVDYCKNCPDCALVAGTGHRQIPPLDPNPVQRPSQIFAVELPTTAKGNCYVIVFRDFFTKWPLVFQFLTRRLIGLPGW